MRHRRALLFSAVVLIGSAIPPALAEQPAAARGPLDTGPDLDAAMTIESRLLDHFHYGQIHEQYYRTAERLPGDIARLVGENDSALYTGNYLAAESFRYALAQSKLGEDGPSPGGRGRGFWIGQRDDALERIEAMVDKFHLLINISESWRTELDPHTEGDDPTADGFVDFGGGVFPAEAGLLFRACNPVDAPAPLNVGRDTGRGRLIGPLEWVDGSMHYCLDATSRDAYAGTTFGLATALDLVAVDHPDMHATIVGDLLAMSNYAHKYLWSTPRPHGEVVVPEVFGGNDLDNFWSPLFVYTPMAQLNMAQVARHAAHVGGTDADRQKWDAIWATELADQLPQLSASMEIDAADAHSAYYKYHLNYITGFNLIRLEGDPTVAELMRDAFAVMDASVGGHGNAVYDAISYAFTGESHRLDAGVLHTRQWSDYRANLDANGNRVVNSTRCGVDLVCVPVDQVDIVQTLPDGTEIVTTRPGTSTDLRAAAPLPIAQRRPGDFMFQKDPTLLDDDKGATWEAPGADFLLPFWMLRYYSEAAPPELAPFTPWAGPTFR